MEARLSRNGQARCLGRLGGAATQENIGQSGAQWVRHAKLIVSLVRLACNAPSEKEPPRTCAQPVRTCAQPFRTCAPRTTLANCDKRQVRDLSYPQGFSFAFREEENALPLVGMHDAMWTKQATNSSSKREYDNEQVRFPPHRGSHRRSLWLYG